MRETDDYRLLRLPQGRNLAFCECGAPAGFPAFYFHGTPSCRLEAQFADAAARRWNLRLIAVDRPGFGRSGFQTGRQFRDWPGDVLAVADSLGLDEFGLLGYSGAGPHLFACGVLIEPRRLRFIGALAPWGPASSPEVRAALNPLDRAFANLAAWRPTIMRMAFAPVGWVARHWPTLFLYLLRRSVSGADRTVLKCAAVCDSFMRIEREAFRQGSRGVALEAALAYRDWGFDVADIRVPTYIVLGDRDVFVSEAMGRALEKRIPGVDFRWLPGEGHFCLDAWDSLLESCKQHTVTLAR